MVHEYAYKTYECWLIEKVANIKTVLIIFPLNLQ